MLIEVPKGITREEILLETPALSSTQSIVIGSVAEEEEVENAVIKAGDIALKRRIGLPLAIVLIKIGSAINI
jgi:hypothetical protein